MQVISDFQKLLRHMERIAEGPVTSSTRSMGSGVALIPIPRKHHAGLVLLFCGSRQAPPAKLLKKQAIFAPSYKTEFVQWPCEAWNITEKYLEVRHVGPEIQRYCTCPGCTPPPRGASIIGGELPKI